MILLQEMDSVTGVQILDVAVCISHNANTVRKCMNPPPVLPLAMSKIVATNNDDQQLSLPTTMTTSCLYYQRPPAVSTFGDYSTSRLYYFHRLYDHSFVSFDKMNCHLLLLLSRLFFSSLSSGCQFIHTNNKKIIYRVDVLIGPPNKFV